MAPTADALYQRRLASRFTYALPCPDISSLYREFLFRDPVTGYDLMTFRSPVDYCKEEGPTSKLSDYLVIKPEVEARYFEAAWYCGEPMNATLICRNLGVATPQCFDFDAGVPGVHGLEFLMAMLGRIFRPSGNEECVVRCRPNEHNYIDDMIEYYKELRNKADKRVAQVDHVRKLRRQRHLKKWVPYSACTPEGLQKFVQFVKQKYPPGSLPDFKEELSSLWFKVPCGSGLWTQGDAFPKCVCPRLSISCGMSSGLRHQYEVTADFYNETSQNAFKQMTTPREGSMSVMQNMEPKRCVYECFTQISPD
ncbi:hypothetical protein GNI_162730 [Gregarina niphandrodes]|uniref:Uncharacterized protein n=1 Tax=Gregarina niphandrodes TaxID=110365 RepID=A0A023AYZ3_GRENI|nr:hypothetical protein GNI_162730 [Gregarina niphandrodes]EZG43688.1 hypothetical protein GNI_162730 [Gregarina niphandrodes]|eukprot:XP_011133095.1 hypothetical protein GNI_162730 [Gregarina niphandrodes]